MEFANLSYQTKNIKYVVDICKKLGYNCSTNTTKEKAGMSNRKNKEDYNATIRVTTITKSMIIFGLLGLIIPKLIDNNYLLNHYFLYIIIEIISVIGSALFSAGLVSIIVEISTIKNLVSDAFNRILTCNFPLDNFNENSLTSLNKEVASKLTGIAEKKIGNTIYRYQTNLISAVKQKYYEYHNMTYHITPDETNNCFIIKMKIECKIINQSLADNIFDLGMKLYKPQNNLSLDECLQLLNISKFEINRKKIQVEKDMIAIQEITHESESKYYDYKIKFRKDLGNVVENKICLDFTYSIPIYDICQSFKLAFPCKNMEHKIYINEDISSKKDWKIRANAYSTFYYKQDDELSNFKVEQNIDTAVTIRFKDWAFPGNGYCVFYQEDI